MYDVEWLQSALNRLTDLWLAADQQRRADITVATHSLEQTLMRYPNECGESRESGRRLCFVGPLAVTFRVNEESRVVTIADVRGLLHY